MTASAGRAPVDAMELNMDPIDIVLIFIGIALVAIVPIGCILTRGSGGKAGKASH